ncbi:MAG TPA: xanthine dehydrogenase family protein subunit M [Thermotogota bacterium]|nr:xanthine dehydrogenase family protein subunit M [Thermotogota bacterium]
MHDFLLERPDTLRAAHDLLQRYGTKAMLKAGGTDLLIWIKRGVVLPECLVDLSLIPLLQELSLSEAEMCIGAGVSVARFLSAEAISTHFPALVDACNSHSDPLVRNRATVVGNVCSAVPSGDLIAPLFAYDTQLEIHGPTGSRSCGIDEFITGPRKTTLQPGEIVTCLHVPLPKPPSSGSYQKAMRREALDIAQAGVCCVFSGKAQEPAGRKVRLTFSAVSAKPVRALKAEHILEQANQLDESMLQEVAILARQAVAPITDVRASSEYRLDMVAELTRRAVRACFAERGEA